MTSSTNQHGWGLGRPTVAKAFWENGLSPIVGAGLVPRSPLDVEVGILVESRWPNQSPPMGNHRDLHQEKL